MKSPLARLLARLAVITIALAALPLGAHPAFAEGPVIPEVAPVASEASVATVAAAPVTAGAHLPPIYFNNTEIDAFNSLVGKNSGVIMLFYPWDLDFDDSLCGFMHRLFAHDRVTRCANFDPGPETHAALMLTWEPGSNPQHYPSCRVVVDGKTDLNAIINGSCDGYIDNFARHVKAWSQRYGDVFLIRPMHEMNIGSRWWSNDSSYPQRFVQAFRHIRDRFNAAGATNQYAQFVWSPNVSSNPNVAWNAIPNYYPGNAYVDWIGLSGFNWNRGVPWMTFSDIYEKPDPNLGNTSVLRYLMCHYPKPIILAEIGSVEGPGGTQTKANWITDAYARLTSYPFVKAITWFNDYAYANPSQADFRVTAGSAYDPNATHYPGWQKPLSNWTSAYKTAIASTRYTGTLPPLSTLTPTGTYCGPIPMLAPAAVDAAEWLLGRPGTTVHSSVSLENIPETITLRVSGLPSGATYSFAPATVGAFATLPSYGTSILTVQLSSGLAEGNLLVQVGATGSALSLTDDITLSVRKKVFMNYLPRLGH